MREEEQAGANGSGDGDGHGRALLVADQGVSKPPQARHTAAELCRLATAARHGRPRAWTRRWRGRREGVSVGGLGRLRPTGQKRGRGLLAPPFPFPFFKFLFLNSFSKFILTILKPFSALVPKTKVVTNKTFYNFDLS